MVKASFSLWLLLAVLMMVQAADMRVMAAMCNPFQLSPCMGAISGGLPPTKECCDRLTAQVPCFCEYLRNPTLKPYIDSPNSKKVVTGCGITPPKC